MAYNWSDRSIGDSLISGIELHIGKSFTPPAKVTLPLACDFSRPSDVLFMEYDFSLEKQVISWSENDRKQRELAAEREARCHASAAIEQSIQSDTEEEDSMMSASGHGMANGRLQQPNNMGNTNMNATVKNSVPQFAPVAAATPAAVATATSHHGGILTPTLVKPQTKPQDKKHEPTINLADFEREEDPFDNVELKTINDMEVLHTVLQTTLPSLAAQNGMLPGCTGNSIYKGCNNHDLSGQIAPLPDIPVSCSHVQTPQTVSVLSQSTTQQMSASYPQANSVPTAFVSATNQDSVQIYTTGSVKYSPSPDGRTSVSHTLKGSRSSPDISNNITHGTARVTQAPPTYTPPPYPTRIQTPPPRPSPLQDADKTSNRYQPLPTVPQTQLKNGTSDMGQSQPQLSQSAATLISQVTDMGQSQPQLSQSAATLISQVTDMGQSQPQLSQSAATLISQVTDMGQSQPQLSQSAATLISQVTDMGFPQDRVECAVRTLGDDDKKVVAYLCLADHLVEQGYKMEDVETSLGLFDNDEEKVALYLQLLTRFREIGFPEDKIQVALVSSDLDEGKAIDSLTGM